MSEYRIPIVKALALRGTWHNVDEPSGLTVADVIEDRDWWIDDLGEETLGEIRAEGINRTPVFVDETGLLRDGYHRVTAIAELGLPEVLASDYADGEYDRYFGKD